MRTNFGSLVKRFARDERGATLIEYSVLIALVTAALIVTINLLGDNIQAAFTRVSNALISANTP